MSRTILISLAVVAAGAMALAASPPHNGKQGGESEWKAAGPIDKSELSSVGRNPYFILEPGFALVLKGGGDELTMTVLDETKLIDGVETRVIEEYETTEGRLTEISRNYFAINKTTQDVYYFGEDVDIYHGNKVTGHEGSWHAGSRNAVAGIMMPGHVAPRVRHYQEHAPGVAMDRAEIVSTSLTVRTTAGQFKNCVKVAETSPMSRGTEYKYYAPGIGMVRYESMELVRYGKTEGRAVGRKGTSS